MKETRGVPLQEEYVPNDATTLCVADHEKPSLLRRTNNTEFVSIKSISLCEILDKSVYTACRADACRG